MKTKIFKKKFVMFLAAVALASAAILPGASVAHAQLAPVINTANLQQNVAVGSTVNITVTATDPNATGTINFGFVDTTVFTPDQLTATFAGSPTSGLAADFSWTPTVAGTFLFPIFADDGIVPVNANGIPTVSSSLATITIVVGGTTTGATTVVTPNPIPQQTIGLGSTATFTLSATTPNGGTINYGYQPTGAATADQSTAAISTAGVFSWTPTAVGTFTFDIFVDEVDVNGAILSTVTLPVTIVVNPALSTGTINVTPANPSVIIGTTQQFTATALDANGVALATQPTFVWTSSTPATGTIDPATGLFTAVALGTTTITATSGTITGTTVVIVVQAAPILTTIVVAPANPSLSVGLTQQFTATKSDQFGAAITATVVWTSSTPATGTIDPATGMFTAIATGTTTITATSGTVVGTTLVTVTPAIPVLGVSKIDAIKMSATADGTYNNGWKWIFNITVPANETSFMMKFGDWTNGSSTIPATNNIQFFSAQSLNAADQAHAISMTAANTYSAVMNIDPAQDLDAIVSGRQIQVTVEVRIPTGTAGGSYSTTYGIQTIDPTIATNIAKVASAKAALALATLHPVQGTDTSVVTMAQAIVNAATTGVTATISSSANSQVANNGDITFGNTQVTGNVTFTLTAGLASDTQAVSVVVPAAQ